MLCRCTHYWSLPLLCEPHTSTKPLTSTEAHTSNINSTGDVVRVCKAHYLLAV